MSDAMQAAGRPIGPPAAATLPFKQPTAEDLLTGRGKRLQQHTLDAGVVRELAHTLFNRKSPFSPADVAALSTRRLSSIYAPEFVRRVDSTLVRVLTSGGRLYVRGRAFGVGVSTLLADVSRSFNFMAQKQGYRERVLYVRLQEVRTSKQLLRVLFERVGCPVTNSDVRLHAMDTLTPRLALAANKFGVSTIVIDHAHNASGGALAAIAGLMGATDPNYDVPLDVSEYQDALPRFGIIVASHKSPGQLFNSEPEILHALADGGEITIEPFADRDALASALRRSDLGLHDLDLTDTSDRLMVDWVLAVTDGRLSLITPLLQLVDVLSRANAGARPNLAMLHAVLPLQRSIRERVLRRTEPALEKNSDGSWPEPRRIVRATGTGEARRKKDRAASLKEQREHRDVAEKERRQMNRRRNVNMPGMEPHA